MENCNLQELKGKNWMSAMAWCWFLGPMGAHRFLYRKAKYRLGNACAVFIRLVSGYVDMVCC